ncbi:uncharacterized protein BXZ73DRAFT_77686 [Epithele typhae]|uniref:uncharacterized protein n=1 Tax=Epithele typhae TaxID=378194 RepID=UPI0020084E4E|nr:uncharacterized protein BXZ73DRAFT_77686 [Epithele typhae]KAH9931662.1 hypothetical protein BXZ73DRAFT_77686 [Epithele typhae]
MAHENACRVVPFDVSKRLSSRNAWAAVPAAAATVEEICDPLVRALNKSTKYKSRCSGMVFSPSQNDQSLICCFTTENFEVVKQLHPGSRAELGYTETFIQVNRNSSHDIFLDPPDDDHGPYVKPPGWKFKNTDGSEPNTITPRIDVTVERASQAEEALFHEVVTKHVRAQLGLADEELSRAVSEHYQPGNDAVRRVSLLKNFALVVWRTCKALRDAFTKTSRLHRDVSLGNIILVRDESDAQFRRGYVIDWDTAVAVDDHGRSIEHGLVGTFPFLSIRMHQASKNTAQTLQDDIESLFYVILYCAYLWLPHDASKNRLATSMYQMFDHKASYYGDKRLHGTAKTMNLRDQRYTRGFNWPAPLREWLETVMLYMTPPRAEECDYEDKWTDPEHLDAFWRELLRKHGGTLPVDDRVEHDHPRARTIRRVPSAIERHAHSSPFLPSSASSSASATTPSSSAVQAGDVATELPCQALPRTTQSPIDAVDKTTCAGAGPVPPPSPRRSMRLREMKELATAAPQQEVTSGRKIAAGTSRRRAVTRRKGGR